MTTPRKESLKESYDTTIKDMRQDLSPIERVLSIILHAPVISHAGAIIGGFLLRPWALLFGATTAIISVIAVSLITHLHGYAPSGVESLIGFAIGWICGVIYELLHTLVRK